MRKMFAGKKAMRGVALRSSRGFLSFVSGLASLAGAGAARATAITAARAARVMGLSTRGRSHSIPGPRGRIKTVSMPLLPLGPSAAAKANRLASLLAGRHISGPGPADARPGPPRLGGLAPARE